MFAATFVLTLIITAPAALLDQWLQSATAGRLMLARSNGTLWHGHATPAFKLHDGKIVAMEAVHWKISVRPLITGKINIDLWQQDAAQATTLVALPGSGGIELNGLRLSLPAIMLGEIAPLLQPAQLTGQIHIQAKQLFVSDQHIEGVTHADWLNAGSALSPINPLGTYHLTFTGKGDQVQMTLASLSGALMLEGAGNWSISQGLAFQGTARAAEGKEESLAQLLAHLGPQESAGVHALTLTPQVRR